MSVESLYEAATDLIKQHNSHLTPSNIEDRDPDGHVNPVSFISRLKIFGGTSEDRLKGMSYEDILDCMEVTGPIKPKLLAKDVAKLFRGKDDPAAQLRERATQAYLSKRRVEQMDLTELFSNYNPHTTAVSARTCPVAARISEMSKGRPCLVFVDEQAGTVNVELSVKLLVDSLTMPSYTPLGEVVTPTGVKKTFRVYERPFHLLQENPLYPGRPLRLEDVCDQTGRSWAGVDRRVKQLVWLAVKHGHLIVTIDRAHDVLDIAVGDNAMSKLEQRYPKAAVKFREAESTGALPQLFISQSQTQSPFAGGRKVNNV